MKPTHSAYTLVEILISITLSLLLLLGVVELFRHVGNGINDAQSMLGITSNMNHVAQQLRDDLKNINADVNKPFKMVGIISFTAGPSDDGYFYIKEGLGRPDSVIVSSGDAAVISTGKHYPISHIAVNETGGIDNTPGDVDDIIAFTVVKTDVKDAPYRGKNQNGIAESHKAEIIWFVRGNTLYRRVNLIEPIGVEPTFSDDAAGFYSKYDFAVIRDPAKPGKVKLATMYDLARRENRFGLWSMVASDATNADLDPENPFPFPIGGHFAMPTPPNNNNNDKWYYLGMPLTEETAHPSFKAGYPLDASAYSLPSDIANHSLMPQLDFWENPNAKLGLTPSGAMPGLAGNRVAEDKILDNVISFDVKVWNPYHVPLVPPSGSTSVTFAPPQYIDLGQDRFYIDGSTSPIGVNYGHRIQLNVNSTQGFGFTLKGKYNSVSQTGDTNTCTRRYLIGAGMNTDMWMEQAEYVRISNTTRGYWRTPRNPMLCVYDAWTTSYEKGDGTNTFVGGPIPTPSTVTMADIRRLDGWQCPPPYAWELPTSNVDKVGLRGIQITIRCFDPRSKNIKQVTVKHSFVD